MTDDHRHEGFEVPAGDPLGRPVDHELLSRFVGAAFDGCTTCDDPLLTLMAEDPATTARLVELACVATQGALGGLPPAYTDPALPTDGLVSNEFRRLAHAGLDGANEATEAYVAMFGEAEQMTAQQRRAAADTAADVLIGHLVTGPPGSAPPPAARHHADWYDD